MGSSFSKRLQPRSYHAFRCIGADCEDTCCVGWIVNIDKHTYEAYQHCDDPELGSRLHELVTINPASTSDDNYAHVTLSGSGLPVSVRRPVRHSEEAGRTVPVDYVRDGIRVA